MVTSWACGYNMDTYVMTQIFSALLILLLKSCDHQKKLGEGRNIETYPGQQKTGILSNKGAIAYDPETKATKFLWREDISSRFQRYVDGIQTKLYKTSVKMTLPDASDPSAETNWVQMREESSTTTSGYIQTMLCDNKYGRFFNKLGGSEDTYETAKWHSVHGKDSTVYHYMSYDYDGPSGYGEDVNSSTRSYSLGVSLTYFPKS